MRRTETYFSPPAPLWLGNWTAHQNQGLLWSLFTLEDSMRMVYSSASDTDDDVEEALGGSSK